MTCFLSTGSLVSRAETCACTSACLSRRLRICPFRSARSSSSSLRCFFRGSISPARSSSRDCCSESSPACSFSFSSFCLIRASPELIEASMSIFRSSAFCIRSYSARSPASSSFIRNTSLSLSSRLSRSLRLAFISVSSSRFSTCMPASCSAVLTSSLRFSSSTSSSCLTTSCCSRSAFRLFSVSCWSDRYFSSLSLSASSSATALERSAES